MSTDMNTANKSLAKRSDLHILRKIWHILTGSSVILAYYQSNANIHFFGWICLSVAAFGFSSDFTRMNLKKYNELVLKVMGPLMRKSEQDGFSGLPFYALGAGLSIFFYQKDIALLSILFLIFADPIASFVGVSIGKDKILPNKSLQGTVAAFFVCNLVAMIYIMDSGASSINMLAFAVLVGLVGAISELVSTFNIDDNLTIPVVSGAGITVVNYFFQIF